MRPVPGECLNLGGGVLLVLFADAGVADEHGGLLVAQRYRLREQFCNRVLQVAEAVFITPKKHVRNRSFPYDLKSLTTTPEGATAILRHDVAARR